MDRRQLLAILIGGGSLALTGPASAQLFGAPRADLWPRWQAHEPSSTRVIDHGPWTALLSRYLSESADGINRIDYGGWSRADSEALDQYLNELAAVSIGSINRHEQFAYWVNFYNALTVRVILDHYPVASIRDIDISPGLFANGPWGRKLVTVDGEALSLDDIEHRILRPIWRDPRVHYAVNCAALGCPNLLPTAFTSARLDAMLDSAARAFVNHPRGARVEGSRLIISSIYSWFIEDFGDSDTGVIAHLRHYAEPDLAASLSGITSVADHDYDWALNDLAART